METTQESVLDLARTCGRRTTIDKFWRHTQFDRVANVMRPYLENFGVTGPDTGASVRARLFDEAKAIQQDDVTGATHELILAAVPPPSM